MIKKKTSLMSSNFEILANISHVVQKLTLSRLASCKLNTGTGGGGRAV